MNNQIQINAIRRAIGQLTMQVGIKQISEAISDFTDTEGNFSQFCKPLLGLPVSQLDEKYYFTSWDNWQKIIATINPILQNNCWLAERFDCDKRALLVTGLVALLFEINTVRPVYCSVHAPTGQLLFYHYANVIVDDAGNAWLWDVDQCGKTTKITTLSPVIDGKKYLLKSIK